MVLKKPEKRNQRIRKNKVANQSKIVVVFYVRLMDLIDKEPVNVFYDFSNGFDIPLCEGLINISWRNMT